MFCFGQDYLGIGTIAAAQFIVIGHVDSGLYLELVGSVVFHGLGRDVFQSGFQGLALQCADSNLHIHSRHELAHFRLVYVAPEYQVAHVGHRGDSGTIVEGVGEYDRVAHFHGHIEYQACDGRTYQCAASLCVAAGDAIAHHFQVVLRGGHFLLGLLVGLVHLVILIGGDQSFVIKYLLSLIIHLGLLHVDIG